MCKSTREGFRGLKNFDKLSPCNRTGQFLRQAAEDGGGVPVFGGAQGVLLCYGRAQIQHVGQFLQGILETPGDKGISWMKVHCATLLHNNR